MSNVVTKCPKCGQTFECDAEVVGVLADCPKCGSQFPIAADVSTAYAARPSGIECYLGIFRRYFGFKGRMARREFWWAFFFCWMASLLSLVLDYAIWDSPNWLSGIVGLGSTVPLVAAQVRRLHDTGKSGWWAPLILLPPINIAYFVWLATAGDKGRNRFGPDPKGR